MAAKSALREYQRRLMERLEAGAEAGAPRSSQLAFESGGEKWLVPLNDIAEVIALPAITPVRFRCTTSAFWRTSGFPARTPS